MKKNPKEYGLVAGKNLFYETTLDMRIGRTYANAPEGFLSAHETAGHVLNRMILHALAIDNHLSTTLLLPFRLLLKWLNAGIIHFLP